ncbi:MAG: type II toxin-antitoxin system VapC family toxin [Dehalococcoidia bacterium]
MIVLMDTHVLVWLTGRDQRLGYEARELVDIAADTDSVLISAFSFWEVEMLIQHGRLQMSQSAAGWRQRVLDLGVREIPLSGDIAILATELKDSPRDAADRIIAATLITADPKIFAWQGELARHNARE